MIRGAPERANVWAFLVHRYYNRLARQSRRFPELSVKNQSSILREVQGL